MMPTATYSRPTTAPTLPTPYQPQPDVGPNAVAAPCPGCGNGAWFEPGVTVCPSCWASAHAPRPEPTPRPAPPEDVYAPDYVASDVCWLVYLSARHYVAAYAALAAATTAGRLGVRLQPTRYVSPASKEHLVRVYVRSNEIDEAHEVLRRIDEAWPIPHRRGALSLRSGVDPGGWGGVTELVSTGVGRVRTLGAGKRRERPRPKRREGPPLAGLLVRPGPRPCIVCESEGRHEVSADGAYVRFIDARACSSACFRAARRRPAVAVACAGCGASLEGLRSDAKFCGATCRVGAFRAARRAPARSPAPPRACAGPACDFTVPPGRTYCDNVCKQRAYRARTAGAHPTDDEGPGPECH